MAFLGSGSYLFGRNGLLAGLAKLLDRLLIVSEILLAADEDDGETLAEVQNLGDPLLKSTCQQGCADRTGYQLWARLRSTNLLLDVVEGIGGVDGEADQDNVRVGVGQGSKTVVILLASSIP